MSIRRGSPGTAPRVGESTDTCPASGSDEGSTVGRRRTRKRWSEKSRSERGIVIVWFSLMLVMLLGFAGFAVDLSNWWLQADRLQKAADSGAHAGVVYLPADLGGATTTARAEVAKNGFRTTGSTKNADVAITQEPNPNRLRVSLTTTVPTYFVRLLGVDHVTLTRDAVAEYIAPIAMGSPSNKLGNDPARGDTAAQFWINVAGPRSTKGSGDRFQAKVCGTSVMGCTNTMIPGVNNDEYASDGYLFAVRVAEKVAGQDLLVQVYDPAFIYVGDKCENSTFPSSTQLNELKTWYPDAPARFAGGLNSWCSGDQEINGLKNTETTFVVRAPDNTPWSDTDNPVVAGCTTTMPAWVPASSGNDSIYGRLKSGAGTGDGVAPWTFSEVFRQNVTICRIPASQVKIGDYILQIRSNASAAAPYTYDPNNATGGHNRFSIQAGFGVSGASSSVGNKVSLNARGRFPIYANANSANTIFYLARIMPYDAGRTLRVSLYDISDVGDSGSMRIVPPTEFGSNFSGCTFSNDKNKSMSYNSGTCTLTVPNGYYNERNVNVDVPIPANYTCNKDDSRGCWITVEAKFNGSVQDTTTWSASILGNPIRLVE